MADLEKLLGDFKNEICHNSKEVDPDEERDWYSLSLGYFIAKGATVEEAYDLSIEARYTHGYWQA